MKSTKKAEVYSVFWVERTGDDYDLMRSDVEATDSDNAASQVAAQLPIHRLENITQAFASAGRIRVCQEAFRGELARRRDEEYEKNAAAREERERAEYERLRLKFEGK